MQTLSSELRATIARHVDSASIHEIASIVSALCAHEDIAILAATAAAPRTPPARFEVVGDVVRDLTTGLEWTREAASDKRLTWAEAKEACEKLDLAGGGWRLPTIKELLSLVDYERHDPAIDPVFKCDATLYWTSTPYAPSPAVCAWGVGFGDGDAGCSGRDGDGFVRAVRGGQF
jgi:uncharacterized protein DUF1566